MENYKKWLREQDKTSAFHYYEISSKILKMMMIHKNSDILLESLNLNLVQPCLNLIKEGKDREAFKLYKKKFLYLKKYFAIINR